jgi:TetR/AcrR family transcriptional regulator, tetracycline repressor protein
MAKIRRDEVVEEALKLLNEVGLDGVTTRRLAQRLGVESATLYWHFQNKTALLSAMSSMVLARHFRHPIPEGSVEAGTDDWRHWLAENARSFRNALLAYRDGARLHAGSTPNTDEINRIVRKVDYLVRAGFPQLEAAMTLYSLGQFTLGCVLEEQASLSTVEAKPQETPVEATLSGPALNLLATVEKPSGEIAFEFGLTLFMEGLARKSERRQVGHADGRK